MITTTEEAKETLVRGYDRDHRRCRHLQQQSQQSQLRTMRILPRLRPKQVIVVLASFLPVLVCGVHGLEKINRKSSIPIPTPQNRDDNNGYGDYYDGNRNGGGHQELPYDDYFDEDYGGNDFHEHYYDEEEQYNDEDSPHNDNDNDNATNDDDDDDTDFTKEQIGARHRFWQHHVDTEELLYKGINYYPKIVACLTSEFTPEELQQIQHPPTVNVDHDPQQRTVGEIVRDPFEYGIPILVVVKNAISPIHAQAVQTLATCTRHYFPHLYESRAMYKEMDKDEDDGSGGNCPTHLGSLVGIFLPAVIHSMDTTLRYAYEAVNWPVLVASDAVNTFKNRESSMFAPSDIGIRASEHLSYDDFPLLGPHTDGSGTVYTMNYAFSAPTEYVGGEFYIVAKNPNNPDRGDHTVHLKPNQYDCLVFLGGKYYHGVTKMKGTNNHREMFSTEFWPYPDAPFGSNLWSNFPSNMEDYIEKCNKEQQRTGSKTCQAEYELKTLFHDNKDDVNCKYGDGNCTTTTDDDRNGQNTNNGQDPLHGYGRHSSLPYPRGQDVSNDNRNRPNRIQPNRIEAYSKVFFKDAQSGMEHPMDDYFKPKTDEDDFLVPHFLNDGELQPLVWREDLTPIDKANCETFVIGLPQKLQTELRTYVEQTSKMLDYAHSILYHQDSSTLRDKPRIFPLHDNTQWTAHQQYLNDDDDQQYFTDMIQLDPANEECFESVLKVLDRGNFQNAVLQSIGTTFDLQSLLVVKIGVTIHSYYNEPPGPDTMSIDTTNSRGVLYKIIIPVHIPNYNDDTNKKSDPLSSSNFIVSDYEDYIDNGPGSIRMHPNVGIVLGGESSHGMGECDYRGEEQEELLLSFVIYLADSSNETKLDFIRTALQSKSISRVISSDTNQHTLGWFRGDNDDNDADGEEEEEETNNIDDDDDQSHTEL